MYVKELELEGLELVDPNADYSGTQTIFIDFDGANGVSYDNDALNIYIDNFSVAHSGLSEEEQFQILTDLNNTFEDTGVTFTVSAPANEEYSTIYVGGDDSYFSEYGSFLGLSETIDAGNQIKTDNAFVFSDKINSTITITETIAHEAGHLLGYKHEGDTTITLDINDFALDSISSGYGVTLITHGFDLLAYDLATWVSTMGNSIIDRISVSTGYAENEISLYTLKVFNDGIDGPSTPNVAPISLVAGEAWGQGDSGMAVILLDWTDVNGFGPDFITGSTMTSTETIAGAVSDYLFTSAPSLLEAPMHLIGHSRGGSLVGALAEDFGKQGVWVDQVTFLDPHPTENGVNIDDWGEDTGISVTSNVIFADNYYREGGVFYPNGETVDAAVNIKLKESYFDDTWYQLGDSELGHESEHSDVHLWYHGTIDNEGAFDDGDKDGNINETEAPIWYNEDAFDSIDGATVGRNSMGYAYSLVGGYDRPDNGLSSDFGGDAIRADVDTSNATWANIGYISTYMDKTSFSVGDTATFNYYYSDYGDKDTTEDPTIEFYLDNNFNPYDNNNDNRITQRNHTHTIGDVWQATDSWTVSDDLSGDYYVYGKIITQDGNTRYSYMDKAITIQDDSSDISGEIKLSASDGGYTDWFGSSVDIDGDNIAVGLMARGAYVYHWNGTAYDEIKLSASDGVHFDYFGRSVAIDDDNIVVGASGDNDNGSYSGSAYVYHWNGIDYDETKLSASDGAEFDYFGRSVSIDGDNIVIGASDDNDNGLESGSAYVYHWNGTDYNEIKLTASDGAAEDGFGDSVAIDGDNIVFGTRNSDSAYVYRWNGIDYDETILSAPVGAGNFATSVAIDGDNIVVGASSTANDGHGSNPGSAYVYRWNGTDYDEIKLTASDGYHPYACFGNSVAIDGDNIVIGAYFDDTDNGTDSGSAYLYHWNGIDYDETILSASDNAEYDRFGSSVAIDGGNIVVGAHKSTVFGTNSGSDWASGSAYVYDLNEIIDSTAPNIPVSLNQIIDDENISLDWSDSIDNNSGVKEYIVEYTDNVSFVAAISRTVTASNLDLTLADNSYFWRVKAVDNNNNISDWSTTSTFDIDTTAPDIPSVLSDSITDNSASLDWIDSSDNLSGVKEYIVEYATSNQFVNATSQTIANSELDLDGLADGKYYWRVKAVDNNNNGSTWSTVDSFVVDIPDGQFKLHASDSNSDDRFGSSVSISGDNFVVGTSRLNEDYSRTGSAYVYRWNGSSYGEYKLTG